MGDNRVDEEDRKLFVGGLAQECTQDDLKEYFGKYGDTERVQLKMDSQTGRSRGFAFIVFTEAAGLDACTADEHVIKGKKATVKKADVKPGKIYVGKLPSDGLTDDDIKNYFADHGVVTEYIRPIDKMKNNEPKNFAFITFDKERVSKKLINMGTVDVNGHKLYIKEVNPNPRDPAARGGGRGGGRGGYGAGQYGGQGYGGGAWDQGGYGGGAWDASAGYGGYGDQGGYDASGYGAAAAGGYGGGYEETGYGGGYGGYGGGMGGGGGKMTRGGRGGRGGGRGRGRGNPY